MKLTLATKSHKAVLKWEFPIVHGMVKLLRSFNLGGNFFTRIVLHSSLSMTVSCSSHLRLWDIISLKNIAYFGIYSKVSIKGILVCNCLNMLKNAKNWCLNMRRNFENSLSILFFFKTWIKGMGWSYFSYFKPFLCLGLPLGGSAMPFRGAAQVVRSWFFLAPLFLVWHAQVLGLFHLLQPLMFQLAPLGAFPCLVRPLLLPLFNLLFWINHCVDFIVACSFGLTIVFLRNVSTFCSMRILIIWPIWTFKFLIEAEWFWNICSFCCCIYSCFYWICSIFYKSFMKKSFIPSFFSCCAKPLVAFVSLCCCSKKSWSDSSNQDYKYWSKCCFVGWDSPHMMLAPSLKIPTPKGHSSIVWFPTQVPNNIRL